MENVSTKHTRILCNFCYEGKINIFIQSDKTVFKQNMQRFPTEMSAENSGSLQISYSCVEISFTICLAIVSPRPELLV